MSIEPVDILITGAHILTMDVDRRILMDGAVAIRGDRIVAVGKAADLTDRFHAKERIDASGFVMTPGFIDCHVHTTGDPLTRGLMPDDIDGPFDEKLAEWVLPRYLSHTAEDEAVSAQLACLEMLKNGTTCFVEAGTIRYLDAVFEAVFNLGIRGRVGVWTEGRAFEPDVDEEKLIVAAINGLEEEMEMYPSGDARVSAWPILVGHITNPDEVWLAAKRLADEHSAGVSAHMSPYASDPDWFLEHTGKRPIEHLADLGVLGSNVSITHAAHVDDAEVHLLAESGTNVTFCPLPALKEAFGITQIGKFPDMAAAGINITLGSDGYDSDLLRAARLASGIFKDSHDDITLFPAHQVLEMVTVNGAKALGLEDEIGSIEVGKKADLVLHDTRCPQWQPITDIPSQLVWAADGRAVSDVWVDGERVLKAGVSSIVNEHDLLERAGRAGASIAERSGMSRADRWPVL